ncbi:estradiol 17-beta-dehydrogenase 8-like [Haemaphysalis longicornis]
MAVKEASLSRRLAVVIGGGGGIGSAICRALADKGARVVVAGITLENARTVAATLPGTADHRALHVNVEDAASVQELFNAIRAFSDVPATIVVNTFAKSSPLYSFENATEEMFDFDIRINLKGTFLVCRAASRAMINAGISDGAIVNISSKAAQQPARGLCGYATAKGGIEALTRSMAMELAPHGIRCNCVAPGFTDTPNTRAFLPEEVCRVAEKASPLGRAALPEEVANVVAFLCCPESSYVIGNTVKVA